MATTRIHQGVVVELIEIIRGAQDAMDRGDYRLSAAACRHVLETFPSSLTAHRMLGESLLELGEIDIAIAHFQQAIAIDPLNVVARLGLGVASEEKRDMNQAYTAYLHAWEINPALDQVRDELVRLRGLLGGGERLHPTRAGLAGIFARGGQYGRAAAEWRAVLLAEPESRRARTSLAEVHWRSGDDTAALLASREALNLGPENVRALALLADVETRRGMPT
ncbi:MAG: tetratricopeptide repeat protein, partial [Verrucomicrobiales bacterium]